MRPCFSFLALILASSAAACDPSPSTTRPATTLITRTTSTTARTTSTTTKKTTSTTARTTTTSQVVVPRASTSTTSSRSTAAPPAATSTAPRDIQFRDDDLFFDANMEAHNRFRRQHDAVPLVWNDTLAAYSQKYLDNMGDTCVFAHSGSPYGENLAIGYRNVTAGINAWGNERNLYSYDKAQFSSATGHFTQLVWKATTEVGCARRLCEGNRGWYLACQYWPRGNVIGRFSQNVAPQGDYY